MMRYIEFLEYYWQTSPLIVGGMAALGIALLIGVIALVKIRQNSSLRYEFITIIAHKFRTPLTHIKLVSEMLSEQEKDPYQLQSINELKKSNTQLINLTGTLIELTGSNKSSTASYVFEHLSLCETAKRVSETTKQSFKEKNISFTVDFREDIQVYVDQARLEFALQTVFENAYIYTQAGGIVRVNISKSSRKAIVTITDNGIGISHGELRRIFGKFHRAANAKNFDTEGLGVGLYLTKSIIHRLHGKIHIYSEGEGKGTTASIILPLARKK